MNKYLLINNVVVQVWKNNSHTKNDIQENVFETHENVFPGMKYKDGGFFYEKKEKTEEEKAQEFSQKIENFIYSKYSEKEQSQDTVWLVSGLADEEKKKNILEKMQWAKDVITSFKNGNTPPEFTK